MSKKTIGYETKENQILFFDEQLEFDLNEPSIGSLTFHRKPSQFTEICFPDANSESEE